MHITPAHRVCLNCNQETGWYDSYCSHCNSPRLTKCINCAELIQQLSGWCHHCGAPQGNCQHCGKYIHRFVDKKCEKCGIAFMYRPEYERREAIRKVKDFFVLLLFLLGILAMVTSAIFVAVKAYSFVVK